MKKNTFLKFCLLIMLGLTTVLFNSCNEDDTPLPNVTENPDPNTPTEPSEPLDPFDPLIYDEGVVINGVKWATRNVGVPGRFVTTEKFRTYYEWNRKEARRSDTQWTGNGGSSAEGTTWAKVNDPSPVGWRVPTYDEMSSLFDTNKVSNRWIPGNEQRGAGREFTDKTTGNTIFLLASGLWRGHDGTAFHTTSQGYYWVSTIVSKPMNHPYYAIYADCFWFTFYDIYTEGEHRSSALAIRPVAE